MKTYEMYINGEWVKSADSAIIDVLNPASSEKIGEIPRGTKEDVDRAVQAATAAFRSEEWRTYSAFDRGDILFAIAEKLQANRDELAELETTDVGKPLSQGYADVDAAIRYFRFYGGAADKVMGDTIPIQDGLLDYVVREPVGVTAHIIPWNYPLQIISRSVAAAIATGNTVVVKSAEDTPLTALRLSEFFAELDLPRGVFNHVTGYGYEAGAALAGHPLINQVTFTGSVATGISVGQAAMANVVPATLELGGKSPNIVFADCDVEATVAGVVRSIVQNAGQTCSAGARLLVEESFKEEFLEKVLEQFGKLSIGAGIEDKDIGPILNERQFDRVMGMINIAREEGEILFGGNPVTVEGYEGGFYIEPTIVDGVSTNSRIAQEEVFGPVLTVFTFKDTEEALELANSTEYGLVAGVWTKDINRAHYLASRIDSGQVFINNYGAGGGVQMPFGGYKKSGFGREKGWAALDNYTTLKNVAVKYR
ncbi:aldehyde dehydrogenase family protein [Oceanobacillus alkalisoli]|uniref:aldehyde dehydrogenase family protein n=1 Tax=Oceanobacillus alkalisoli TaxID=2925113 RepID=UPI001EF0040B|nr:aldehyde dehydrogenase family protein [Oceanobacillus alkalisoli]MCF3944559.1 aldehyde dehydrogenase family protein [Oceanobacillus alkalisoli]MCG5102225.1 aldehyde dehydrogenase family protein [Oceanobacillus alkalisoli]